MGTSWFVLRTRYGSEERLAAAMRAAGCDAWYARQRVYVKRRGEVELPLGHYVFVLAEAPLAAELWHVAAGEEGFVGWMGGEVPTAMRAGELEVWRSGLEGDAVDWEASARLRLGYGVGDSVVVVGPPGSRGGYAWTGTTGVCVALDKKFRVSIKITALFFREQTLRLPAAYCERVLIDGQGSSNALAGGSSSGKLRTNNDYRGKRHLRGKRKFLRSAKHL